MSDLVRSAAGSDAGGDAGARPGGGGGGLGEVDRGAPEVGAGQVVQNRGYGARFRQRVLNNYGPDASGVEGTGTIQRRFQDVIRLVPEFAGVQVEQLPAFRMGLAADAIINLSSARGVEVGQTMVFFFGDQEIQVSRVDVLAAMFGTADFEHVQLTRVHRGVRKEISTLLKDASFISTLNDVYGIKEVTKRMDYLSDNFRFDRVARTAAVGAALAASADEPNPPPGY